MMMNNKILKVHYRKSINSHKGTEAQRKAKDKMNENEIGKIVVDTALTLHKELGLVCLNLSMKC